MVVQQYICRLQELNRSVQRHSHFWIGLYGQFWIGAMHVWSDFATRHFAQAFLRAPSTKSLPYLKAHARLFALVKAERKRHVREAAYVQLIWGEFSALS
jgi:hypothetical protein